MLAYLNTMPVLNNEAWADFAALVDNYSVFILHILWNVGGYRLIAMRIEPMANSIGE